MAIIRSPARIERPSTDPRPDPGKFREPDFYAPLDVELYVRQTPPHATIKGLFLSNHVAMAGERRTRLYGVRERYVAFKDYPLKEHVQLLPDVAQLLHPHRPLRDALRRVGQKVYPAFASSLLGKVMFQAVGHDIGAVIRTGTKAFRIASNVGRVDILRLGDKEAWFRLDEMYNYIDAYQVGVFEGPFLMFGLEPTVRVWLDSPTSGEFYVTWR
jgi:uncharacterized protein (TIGR02265 family)